MSDKNNKNNKNKKLCYKHKATGWYISIPSTIVGLNTKPSSKKYKFEYYGTSIKEIKKDFIVIKVHKDSGVYFKNQEYFDSLPASIYIDIKNPDNFITVKINVKEDLEIVEAPKGLWDQLVVPSTRRYRAGGITNTARRWDANPFFSWQEIDEIGQMNSPQQQQQQLNMEEPIALSNTTRRQRRNNNVANGNLPVQGYVHDDVVSHAISRIQLSEIYNNYMETYARAMTDNIPIDWDSLPASYNNGVFTYPNRDEAQQELPHAIPPPASEDNLPGINQGTINITLNNNNNDTIL